MNRHGKKKLISSIIMLCLAFTLLVGCKKTENNPSNTNGIGTENNKETPKAENPKEKNKDVVLRIFNAKGENALQFEAMCEAYSEETGVTVEPFSVGSGTNALELLRVQMSTKNPPAIYSIKGLTELPEWKESGSVLDLTTVTNETFAQIVKDIPESMRLSTDGQESLGIPFNVEGYGYMVDVQMLGDLFGAENGVKVLADLRVCTFEEFAAFVETVDAYIAVPSGSNVTLNGNTYTLQSEKTGRASNLTGVFAFAGSEKWTYGDHSLNIILNMVFNSAGEAKAITEEQYEQLRAPLTAYMKNLNMVTSHVAGLEEHGSRGPELINGATFGYDQSVQAYGDGKALFLQQGNWAALNIENVSQEVAGRSSFIPVKMPVTSDMLQTGKTVEEFNNSIPVYVPNYYAINSKVSAEEQEAAIEFLNWLSKPENIQKYVIDEFKSIPYNADSSYNIADSYSQSIITYMDEGRFLSNPYMGVPKPWIRDVIAAKVMEEYLTKKDWTEEDINALVEHGIAGLKELNNQ